VTIPESDTEDGGGGKVASQKGIDYQGPIFPVNGHLGSVGGMAADAACLKKSRPHWKRPLDERVFAEKQEGGLMEKIWLKYYCPGVPASVPFRNVSLIQALS
jgi:hypothetical protein